MCRTLTREKVFSSDACFRELDKTAALQRQREEEAIKRREEARANPMSRITDRTGPERVVAAPSRPIIAGAAGGWRQREAERAASGQAAPPQVAPATVDIPTDAPATENGVPRTAPAAQRSGYIAPHLRAREGASPAPSSSPAPPPMARTASGTESPAASAAPAGERWRPRPRGDGPPSSATTQGTGSDRTGSPAMNGAAPRTFSGRGDAAPVARTDSSTAAPAPAANATGGKYVPKFRRGEQ